MLTKIMLDFRHFNEHKCFFYNFKGTVCIQITEDEANNNLYEVLSILQHLKDERISAIYMLNFLTHSIPDVDLGRLLIYDSYLYDSTISFLTSTT